MRTMEIALQDTNERFGAGLEALIARCEADRGAHMTDGGCSAADLRCVEEALGYALPAELRLFLTRLGGGVFYLQHEIFGARRVMIHDIELIPDMLSFRSWLGPGVPPHLLPIHRAEGRIHVIELGAESTAAVRVLGSALPRYPSFTSFLENVVVPRAGR